MNQQDRGAIAGMIKDARLKNVSPSRPLVFGAELVEELADYMEQDAGCPNPTCQGGLVRYTDAKGETHSRACFCCGGKEEFDRAAFVAACYGEQAMNPVGPLKSKTAAVLAFIQEFIAANRYPPTVREITDGCALSSTSVADYQLDILEKRGLIIRYRGKARGIRLTSEGG